MLRSGFIFSFAAVLLQIAVFLQPLLPQQYQIAPVCETITRALFTKATAFTKTTASSAHHHHEHAQHAEHSSDHLTQQALSLWDQVNAAAHVVHDHDHASHQCQYCTVYGNLILPPSFDLYAVIDRIQVRLLAVQDAQAHVWFALQRLFLMPQGRAPPQLA